MHLARYQEQLSNEIYDMLVMHDEQLYINLYSSPGSGKTTIANSIIDSLKENWKVFYIEGIDNNLSPYLTWFIGTKLHSANKWEFDNKLSFGVGFIPVSYSLEFGLPRKELVNYILTPSEEAILQDIKKQSASCDNVLLIVDNYELWDAPSKQFLQKLLMPQLGLVSDFRFNVLILSIAKTSIENNHNWVYFSIENIEDDDILFVLHQNGFSSQMDLKSIKAFAGNNLSLALMVGKYYDDGRNTFSHIDKILEYKIDHMQKYEQEACKILEPLSIIDSFFSQEEAAFFISSTLEYNLTDVSKAEEYLCCAEKQKFIIGNESYRFTNDVLKSYFYSKLSRKAKYLHRQFSTYLNNRHPDDYYNRAKHLQSSIWKNDVTLIIEAWQLYFLAYSRFSADFGWDNDIYEIVPKIYELLQQLDIVHYNAQKSTFDNCIKGYLAFTKYDYRTAISYLQGISPMQLCLPLRAEIFRIVILCHIQLCENKSQIYQSSLELYNLIESEEFNEDDQYCRAALVLLDVYIDKSNDYIKVQVLKRKLTQLINKHLNSPTFLDFYACFNRKSALYYSATIACRQTQESIMFYRSNNNQTGLYMSLCNYAANAIIAGDYNSANNSLNECRKLIDVYPNHYFPSHYKLDNNNVLLSYLIAEQRATDNIINVAKKARADFFKLLGRNEDEVSHVILLNYLSLSALSSSNGYTDELEKANHLLIQTDEFYQFYLHDLNFASSLTKGDLKKAEKELAVLNNLDVPLLHPYEPIFRARRQIQTELLNDSQSVIGKPQVYDDLIKRACKHIQDSCNVFYGRGFLLSDLQFLSF